MTLQDILRGKGAAVHTILPAATLDDVVQKLVRCGCGSLVVCDPAAPGKTYGRLLGIITERDILRACAGRIGALDSLVVADFMSQDVLAAQPDDSVGEAMGLMTNRRVRHLPIVDRGVLVGLVSIGDLVKAQHDEMLAENHHLKNYLHG
jgi:CBS domain-containing protein